jgi:hypothetical protein
MQREKYNMPTTTRLYRSGRFSRKYMQENERKKRESLLIDLLD